jgi:DNA-binding MarR family transcriptional regulator
METDELADAVAALQTELNRADQAAATENDVGSAEDLQVLRLLLGTGPLRVGELARRRHVSVATASARLDRLEKRGLVVRERVPDDRRAVWARLTDTGRAVAAGSRDARYRALAPLASGFPIDRLRALTTALSSSGVAPSGDQVMPGAGS